MLTRVVLRHGEEWRQFEAPLRIVRTASSLEVMAAMRDVEAAVATGLHAVGFVSYEAAGGFDPALHTRPRGHLPLVWFGLFTGFRLIQEPTRATTPLPAHWQLATDFESYRKRLGVIREALASGRSYQVNHTERLHADSVDPVQLFNQVAADAPYAALIETDAFAIVSASPELFFSLHGNEIVCKPMKGTAARGLSAEADRERARWLSVSGKNRAENVMITDMVRNDVGRLARTGSVEATDLFEVQRLRNVWQMTSTVSAFTEASITKIFQALFPGASVTGAPKASSMTLISELESAPREIYTGAIGHIAPGRQAQFSIAIRTAWTDRSTGRATYGAGGGIVWDSEPEEEFAELLAKASVVSDPAVPDFCLLETLLWTPEAGWFLWRQHLDRLAASADYFGFRFDREAITQAANKSVQAESSALRVRLILARDGGVDVSCIFLAATPTTVAELRLVSGWVDTGDVFMFHKTTQRARYEKAGAGDEVLLCDDSGRITESTIANVVYQLGGSLYTPPVQDGVLPGTFRAWMLELGMIMERSLYRHELKDVETLLLVNALRGVRRVGRVLAPEGKVLFEHENQVVA